MGDCSFKGGQALIHCGGGKGRGTAAACVLMTLGNGPEFGKICVIIAWSNLDRLEPALMKSVTFEGSLLDPNACLNIIRCIGPKVWKQFSRRPLKNLFKCFVAKIDSFWRLKNHLWGRNWGGNFEVFELFSGKDATADYSFWVAWKRKNNVCQETCQ